MSQFLVNLPLYVLGALFFGVITWALLYGLPLALFRAVRAPVRLPTGKSLLLLALGAAIIAALFLIVRSVPFGALPCGPRFPCPAGAEFVYVTQHPLSFLFKAGPLACLLLFSLLLIVAGGRSLLARDAA